MAKSSRFVPDSTYSNDKDGRVRQIDVMALACIFVPPALPLGIGVVRQSARQRQYEHHDVVGDVVKVNPPRIAHNHRVIDQIGVKVTGKRSCVRILQPPEAVRFLESFRRNPPKRGVRFGQLPSRGSIRLRRNHFVLWERVGKPSRPLTSLFVERRHHHELRHMLLDSCDLRVDIVE